MSAVRIARVFRELFYVFVRSAVSSLRTRLVGTRRISRSDRQNALTESETIADAHIVCLDETRSKFDCRKGPKRCGHAPRPQPLDDFGDDAITRDEEHIDRELHPDGVNRVTRRQHQRVPLRETVTPEKPAAAGR
jgi:hypothetical protein